MADPNISALVANPRPLLDTMQGSRGVVFQRSNLFLRDLQYGLWRYLNRNQTKYPYEDMEHLTDDLIDQWIAKGVVRRIDNKSVELLLSEYGPAPAAETTPEPAKEDHGPAQAEAAAPAQPSVPPTSGDDAAAKQARIAELQRKMAEAKARREQGG
jgi:hypothetical protein